MKHDALQNVVGENNAKHRPKLQVCRSAGQRGRGIADQRDVVGKRSQTSPGNRSLARCRGTMLSIAGETQFSRRATHRVVGKNSPGESQLGRM